MLQHRHAPSPDEHQLANPATSSARVNPSRSASSATTAPTPRTFLDPWNSSSTGHQRAENRLSGSTSWRSSRNLKLGEQYRGGLSGGSLRVADTVGAGSEDFDKDGRKPNGGWQKGASGLRMGGQKSLTEVWGASKASAMAKKSLQEEESSKHVDPLEDVHEDRLEGEPLRASACSLRNAETVRQLLQSLTFAEHSSSDIDPEVTLEPTQKQIFRGLCFYLNGSTAPLISDHKLKHLLSAHGAGYSIALGRRTVTHVILGTTCGGGLSGSKLQKEITKKGGKSVKFITADWYVTINPRCPSPTHSSSINLTRPSAAPLPHQPRFTKPVETCLCPRLD
jgi:hypothetical protein